MKHNKSKKSNKVYIYGKHALMEAIFHSPHVIERVFLSREVDDRKLRDAVRSIGVGISELGSSEKTISVGDRGAHQGVVAQIKLDRLVLSYDEFIKDLKVTDDTSLLILGEIEDPQNVGAIIRSAAAFGVSGVILPEHNQAQITGSVVKVSAGMAFRLPIVSVGNINHTVRDLKDKGFWVYGLDREAKQSVSNEKFEKPSVFILGNEARGIREKTRELCDILLSVPINSKCESLNVAASATVALYAWSMHHKGAVNK